MTQKDHEDRFIERCKKEFGALTWESELLLRYGYSTGVTKLGRVAYNAGVEVQRDQGLEALGTSARKERALP